MAQYPTVYSKNQFGEASNSYVIGGSNEININFIVDASNGNGLGIRSLKGSPLVSNVYMHTSATPAASNPNPAVGYAIIQMSEAFTGYIGGFSGVASPVSGTPVNISSGLTQYKPYVVTSVGTSTIANWAAVGWLGAALPAVGAVFVASTASAGTGTGVVEASSVSGLTNVEVVGDPNQTLNPASGGGYFVVQLLGATSSSVTTLIPTAPASGSVIGMTIKMNNPTSGPVL